MILKQGDSEKQTQLHFQAALHTATGLAGDIVPDTAALIAATGLDVDTRFAELPIALQDPFAALDRHQQAVVQPLKSCSEVDVPTNVGSE
jgi:hypothetical protein